MARHGFEEQLPPVLPQRIGAFGCHQPGLRDVTQPVHQGGCDAKGCQGGRVGEQGQIAFVGQQRMIVGIGCQHHRIRLVGVAQSGMARFGQSEIHQPIVDQINRQIAKSQPAFAQSQCLRIADHRIDAVADQHLLCQHEFGVKILLLRRVIHDGNAAQRGHAALALPLRAEHRNHLRLESCDKAVIRELHTPDAAPGLRPRQQGVQKGTPRVGVHLDQFRAIVTKVEIIPHQHTLRPMIKARNLWRPAKNRVAEGR